MRIRADRSRARGEQRHLLMFSNVARAHLQERSLDRHS
jgi:hypothetical protein